MLKFKNVKCFNRGEYTMMPLMTRQFWVQIPLGGINYFRFLVLVTRINVTLSCATLYEISRKLTKVYYDPSIYLDGWTYNFF